MPTISELKPGDHVCLAWENEDDHEFLLTRFLTDGLKHNEKVIYFTDSHGPAIAIDYLMRSGFDVGLSFTSGQFRTLDAESVYLRNNYFDVDRMISLLQSEMDRALGEGYTALRVTGEMTWFFLGAKGSNRLFEYEARLNDWFPTSRCIGLCQYDCKRFPQAMMRKAVATHPLVEVNGSLFNNPGYLNWPRYQQHQAKEAGQPPIGTCSEIASFFGAS